MKKEYSAPEIELVRFSLSTAALSDGLILTSTERPVSYGRGMEELPEEPGIDLDAFGI